MERLLKYCPSLLFVFYLWSCKPAGKFDELTPEARKNISKGLLDLGEKGYPQGSPENMYLIKLAIEADSSNAAAWRELSVPYLKRGLPNQWKPLFDKAVEHDPATWQAWRGYEKLFFYRDYKGAIEDFNATDSLTPNFTDYPQGMSVDYLRGLCYMRIKAYELSKNFFTKYIDEVSIKNGEQWVDAYAFLYRALVYEHMGIDSMAYNDLSKHLKYHDTSSDGYYHLARLDFRKGKIEDAKRNIDKAKQLFTEGHFMNMSYVEVFEQIYSSDIEKLGALIFDSKKNQVSVIP